MSTSNPMPFRRRAATFPSPPLLPLPQTIRTGPCGASPATASASAVPAASINSAEGTPCSSIAHVDGTDPLASYSGFSQVSINGA